MLLLVFAVAAMLRRASAAARHTVWSSGFLGLLVLPLLATTLPWRLEVLPAAATVVEPRSMAAVPVAEPFAYEAAAPVADEPVVANEDSHTASETPAASDESITAPTAGTARTAGFAFWFTMLWIVGAALVVGRVVLGAFIMSWLNRRGATIDEPAWDVVLNAAARQIGVTKRVRLIRS